MKQSFLIIPSGFFLECEAKKRAHDLKCAALVSKAANTFVGRTWVSRIKSSRGILWSYANADAKPPQTARMTRSNGSAKIYS